MTFSATEQFANKSVYTWQVGKALRDSEHFSTRLSVEPYDDDLPFPEYFKQFIQQADVAKIDSLLIGCWGEAYEENSSLAIKLLIEHQAALPNLKNLFIGDMQLEESEVSWIQQSDISPIYQAFPELEVLKVRGSEGLSLGTIEHNKLQRLILETGGMCKSLLESVRLANLPELTHLELWLGEDDYGCTVDTQDIKVFLDSLQTQFPKLHYFGLCNYYLSDELAQCIAENGIPSKITTLDLSKGNLSDQGAQALLECNQLSSLSTLDLHHHYLSQAMMDQVSSLAATVDVSEQNEEDKDDDEIYRYIFVSE